MLLNRNVTYLNNFLQFAKVFTSCTLRFVNVFVEFPKPLVAAINGPAITVSVTVLAMFDAVYATEKVNT